MTRREPPTKRELESSLEAYMKRQVERVLAGKFIKLLPGLEAAIPDRLILLPGGRMFLVELKAEGEKPRPLQLLWHARAAELGTHVIVLAGRAQVDAWLREQAGYFDDRRAPYGSKKKGTKDA